jgi:hypothetical protein
MVKLDKTIKSRITGMADKAGMYGKRVYGYQLSNGTIVYPIDTSIVHEDNIGMTYYRSYGIINEKRIAEWIE